MPVWPISVIALLGAAVVLVICLALAASAGETLVAIIAWLLMVVAACH